MSKTILKTLCITLALTLAMTMAAFGAEGTYKEGDPVDTTIVEITGVGANDEVTLLALPTGVALSDATESNILYINQKPADGEGKVTFELPLKASEIDIYSGYTSMGDDELALDLTYDGSTSETKTYKVTFNDIDGKPFDVIEVEEEGTVKALPNAPEVEGFTFKGWFVGDEEFTTATVIKADLSVDAKYDEAVTIVYGDVDGDDEITLNDAVMTLKFAADTLTPSDSQNASADVDGDDDITLNDAVYILKKAAGSITSFPVENN